MAWFSSGDDADRAQVVGVQVTGVLTGGGAHRVAGAGSVDGPVEGMGIVLTQGLILTSDAGHQPRARE